MVVENNLSCGENFPYDRLSCGEVSPQEKFEENLSHGESSKLINVEQNVLCGEMWRNLSCGEMFPHDRLLHMNQLTFFCCKISFVAIYDVLSRNLFCRDLRAFVWRKI